MSKELPQINPFSGEFQHPGISITAETLGKLQNFIKEKQEPWFSYYQAMSQSDYSQKVFRSENLVEGTFDTPREKALISRPVLDLLIADSYRSYTQILQYAFTGEAVYYDNTLQIVRIWCNTLPDEMRYFPDAHIHVGWSLYYLVSTAELLRCLEVPEGSIPWEKNDGDKLIKNFLEPAVENFYRSQDRYMNQLGYQNVGRLAAAIFMDDRDLYHETLEWITVNKTTKRPYINGAVRFLFQHISKDDPRNPAKTDYVQLMEMGRDSGHAFDDLSVYGLLGRMMTNQQTKVDPVSGEVSTDEGALTLYEFDDCALLKAAEQFYRFNLGYTVPWTEFSQDGGKEFPAIVADGVQNIIDYGKEIAQLERGRTRNLLSYNELYDAYYSVLGWSKEQLAKVAPSVSRIAEQLRPPIFYEGLVEKNFWDVIKDLTPEYWTNIPEKRGKELSGLVTTKQTSPQLAVATAGTILAEEQARATDAGFSLQSVKTPDELDETCYTRDFPLDTVTKHGGNHFCLLNLHVFPEWIALKLRTTGEGRLLISGGNNGGRYQKPYQEVVLPNTEGQWVEVPYCRQGALAEEMDFFVLVAEEAMTCEIAAFRGLAATPEFIQQVQTLPISYGGLVGEKVCLPWEILADYQWQVGTDDATIEKTENGVYWQPTQAGLEKVVLTVTDHQGFVTALELAFHGVTTETELRAILQTQVGELHRYTKKSQKLYHEVLAEIQPQNTPQAFLEIAIAAWQKLLALEELNPQLENGTLDYSRPGLVRVSLERATETIKLANLVDNDTETIDGNLYSKWLCLDFGPDYRISSTRFGLQARTGFPNRTQGQRVYGSQDGQTWDCLTPEMTQCINELQWLAVDEAYKNVAYRYLKVQVDEPGPDTDPAYPGLSSRGEFYLDSQRVEAI